jgi:hypothetical protein
MLVVCSVAQNAHAANKKNISGSGCVEKVAKNSCRVVIDSQTGELYNLLSCTSPEGQHGDQVHRHPP